MNLQAIAIKIIENCGDWGTQKISLTTAINLHRLASGYNDDYVIFDNAGGMLFAIWSGKHAGLALEESFKQYIHAYRIGGEEVIVREPAIDSPNRFIRWVKVKKDE